MPIIVTAPTTDQPFGYGYAITVRSDVIGPVLNPNWQFSLFAADNETLLISDSASVTDPHVPTTRDLGVPLQQPPRLTPQLVAGQNLHLQVTLNSSTGIVETTSVNVTSEPVAGVARTQLLLGQQASTQGFTSTDRAQLQETNELTQAVNFQTQVALPFSDGVGDLVVGLGQFLSAPINQLLHLDPSTLLLSGRGSLERPTGAGRVAAYGAFYGFDTLPEFFGLRDGVPPMMAQRIAQFSVVRRDGSGQQYFATIEDVRADGQELIWGGPSPDRIDYDITPGCVVSWRWLLLPLTT